MDNRELIETARHAGIHLVVSGAAAAAVLIGYLSGFHGVSLLVGVFGLATLGSGWRMLRAADKARAEPQPTPARAPAGVDPTPSPADDLVAQTPRGAPAAIAAFDDQRDPVDAWQDLVDTLPDPVVVTMPDGTIAHFNPAFADHYPRARAGSALIAVLRSPELSDALDDLTEGDMPRLVVIEDRVPVQRQWSAIASALPGRMDHGEDEGDAPGVSGHLVMLRDMTEQQRHAQQRSDFIAYASHELRTPLATLKSMTETLLGPARNDEAARDRFLGMMAAQADRMSRLINDLLTLSRAEMRVHVPPSDPIDLNDVLRDVVDMLTPLAEDEGKSIKLSLPDTRSVIRGDHDDLVQVFQNLAQNALKYGRDGGSVWIEAERRVTGAAGQQSIAVSVTDEGEGIPPEHLPRLTERFYRVSVASSRSKGGTGLGLAIVKYIVNRHRGELQVTSKLGEGSCFTVILEAVVSPAAIAANRAQQKIAN